MLGESFVVRSAQFTCEDVFTLVDLYCMTLYNYNWSSEDMPIILRTVCTILVKFDQFSIEIYICENTCGKISLTSTLVVDTP